MSTLFGNLGPVCESTPSPYKCKVEYEKGHVKNLDEQIGVEVLLVCESTLHLRGKGRVQKPDLSFRTGGRYFRNENKSFYDALLSSHPLPFPSEPGRIAIAWRNLELSKWYR